MDITDPYNVDRTPENAQESAPSEEMSELSDADLERLMVDAIQKWGAAKAHREFVTDLLNGVVSQHGRRAVVLSRERDARKQAQR